MQVVERLVLGERGTQQVTQDAVHAVVGTPVGAVEHPRIVVALHQIREQVVDSMSMICA